MPWGGARVFPRHVPRGGLPLLGHRAGRGGGQRVIEVLRARGVSHFCVRPCAARAVFSLLRHALAVSLCCSWGGKHRGAWARLVGWSVPMSWTSVIAPRSRGGGGFGGLFPHPLRRHLVGRGPPWLRVCGVLSLRLRVGRRPWEGGGG